MPGIQPTVTNEFLESSLYIGEALHVMGRETRRELKFIPAKAVIVEHVQYVYLCRECEKSACSVPVVKAPVDEPVIKGGFASLEAVAHIMTQKYVSGVPLYRQEQEFDRHRSFQANDVELDRKVFARLAGAGI